MGKLNSELVLHNDQGLNPVGSFEQAALQVSRRSHVLDSRDCVSPTINVPASLAPQFSANSGPEVSVPVLPSQGCHQSVNRTETVCDSDRLENSPTSSGFALEEAVLLENQGSTIKCNDTDSKMLKFQSKRFIMFDCCKGRQQIFLHPALAQELSCTTKGPLTMSEGSCPVSCMMVGIPGDCTGKVSQSHPCFCSRLEDGSMTYRETVAPAFETLQCMRNSRLCNLADVESQTVSPCVEMEAESSSNISCNGVSQVSGTAKDCYSHENSEDIDALLSSDDEVSSASHTSEEILDGDWYNDASCRKRVKVLNTEHLNANPSAGVFSGVSVTAANPVLENSRADLMLLGKQDSHFSNIDSAEMCSRSLNADSRHMHSYMSGHCGSARKARKQKIRSTVKTLRKIIPGGDCMDAAVVLDEAIHYLKSLQNKVQQLEANRQNKQS
eukprot:c27724_g1_i2 orf=435-1757(-)